MASARLLRGRPVLHRIEGAEEGARHVGNAGQEVSQSRPGEGCRDVDQGFEEVRENEEVVMSGIKRGSLLLAVVILNANLLHAADIAADGPSSGTRYVPETL